MQSIWKGNVVSNVHLKQHYRRKFLIIRIGNKLKTTHIKCHVREIKFPFYENVNVFHVKLFKQYIEVTKSLRGSMTFLFITASKPYRPASKDALERWIESVLHDAGIDMKNFITLTALDKIAFNRQSSNKKYL